MKKYLISFYWETDTNSSLAVSLRSKLEKLSPDKWIHIFPNLLVIQSELSINDLYSELLPEAEDTKIIIVEFNKSMVNEAISNNLLDEYGY
ncbi:hypothetical protein F6X86_13040 [Enterococcus durans]|uniref:Uncharacterized protein n=1 Tax=Enterococcus durans TaxID=53345 RepID=A0A5N0YL76_9ENTE|nr:MULTISPECIES: hypothetical protein [Enterococcus]KAA9176963.1 hypothetical protein F6X86_13040 [Enterococcus durans]KAA9190811.1 hypothetical protein F6X87_12995 [Enterococcus durans]KAA9203750.1 hypothetical protein F6X95_12805 [Enterococcus durans]TKN13793.1 hypothetical protein DVW83_14300 [Enterococcus sp. VV15]